MKPALYNPTELAHSRFWRRMTLTAAGVPVDLTGYTARMSLRKKSPALDLVVDADETSGIVLGGPAGTVEFDMDTSALPEGEYLFTLILYQGTAPFPLIEGRLTLTPNMVRSAEVVP